MLEDWRRLYGLLEAGTGAKLVALLALMLAGGFLEMVGLGLLLPFLQLLVNPEKLELVPVLGPSLQVWASSLGAMFLAAACFALLLFFLFKNGFLAFLSWMTFRFTFDEEAKLERRLLASYFQTPYPVISGRNSSEMIRAVSVSARSVCNGVMTAFLTIAMEAVMALAAIAVFILVDPLGALLVTTLMALLVLLLYLPLRHRQTRKGQENQFWFAQLIKSVQQSMGILKESRVAGREGFFLNAFGTVTEKNAAIFSQMRLLQTLPALAGEALVLCIFLAYILYAAYWSGGLEHALPILAVFAAATLRLLPAANRIVQQMGNIRQGKSALSIVCNDLEHYRAVDQTERAVKASDVPPLARDIVLKDVSFYYPESETPSLDRINLTIRKGTATALVGPSGAGKSTLADLLLGLLPPQSGDILIDGHPIAPEDPGWRRQLGYVPQTIYLLDDTVRRNIAFGVPDSDIDEAAVVRAVKLAGLEEVVNDLSKGLSTVTGEAGSRLSGGQRQRIGIARALYHSPSLLVFDEITSALDGETEKMIVESIVSLRNETTIIVIAHRLSTIKFCDDIVLMNRGQIESVGGFDDLMERSPLFSRLAEHYS